MVSWVESSDLRWGTMEVHVIDNLVDLKQFKLVGFHNFEPRPYSKPITIPWCIGNVWDNGFNSFGYHRGRRFRHTSCKRMSSHSWYQGLDPAVTEERVECGPDLENG